MIDAEGLDAFAVDPAEGVLGLSRGLIEAGKLTAYQAAAVYQRKGRGLLIGNYLILDKLGAALVITDLASTQPTAIERLLRLAERKRIPAVLIADDGVVVPAAADVRVLRSPLHVAELVAGVAEMLERGALAGEPE